MTSLIARGKDKAKVENREQEDCRSSNGSERDEDRILNELIRSEMGDV